MSHGAFRNLETIGPVVFTEQLFSLRGPRNAGHHSMLFLARRLLLRRRLFAACASRRHGWPSHTFMKLFAPRPALATEVAPDEPDFPLPVADPSVPPMHRQCVLKGCSYRSRFLFAAGWMLAVCFLVASIAIAFYGVSTQEGLLRENALLIEALRDRDGLRSETPLQVKPSEPAPLAGAGIESSEPLKAPSPPTKISPRPRRPPERPQKPLEYTVPEEEKWWNRP